MNDFERAIKMIEIISKIISNHFKKIIKEKYASNSKS
jgi:hypothetical protein